MSMERLILEDGSEFRGRSLGASRSVSGEVVFNTGMVGYTESLSDPSYSGQILCLTYPLVGNYGVPPQFESGKIQVTALVVSELAAEYSHAMAQKSLPQWLREQKFPASRAWTRARSPSACATAAACSARSWSAATMFPSMTPIRGIWWGGQ